MKRFQECNRIVKIWRYRWYLLIPLQWIWYSIVGFKVYKDEIIDEELIHTDNYDIIKGKNLWQLLKGAIHYKMGWYWTHEEVTERINKLLDR